MKEKFMQIAEGIGRVPVSTWTKLIGGLILIINAVLAVTGHNPIQISDANLYIIISSLAGVLSAAYLIWKNFSVTPNAQASDEILKALNDGTVAFSQVVEFINNMKNQTNTTEKVNQSTIATKKEDE